MEQSNIQPLQQAAELIYKGLNSKLTPSKDAYYKKLIAKWDANELFREQVNAIAKGFRLKVADVSYEAGAIIVPIDHHSAFRFGGLTEIRKSLKVGKHGALLKRGSVVLGLIALLATFFRDEVDFLGYEKGLQTRSVSQIATLLLEICESLQDEYDDDKGDIPDYLREGWQVMLLLPRVKQGKAAPNSVEGIIEVLAKQFVDEGLLVKDASNRDETAWFATQRFIAQAKRETVTGIYEYCMDIHRDQLKRRKAEATIK